MKKKIRTYNDGFIHIYNEKPIRTDFGAKRNTKNKDTLEFVVKLAYNECSKRQEDIDFAEGRDKTLNLKVRTRLLDTLNTEQKVIIDGVLYDIINIDYDRSNREMYFYLEKVKVIGIE